MNSPGGGTPGLIWARGCKYRTGALPPAKLYLRSKVDRPYFH